MSIAKQTADIIDRLPKGYIFTYLDFIDKVNNKEALIKALNRMVTAGKINKLSKGKYYKPELTPFGEIQPDQYQIVKDLLEKDGAVKGYLTGLSIYNKLGLTTQISNTIQIASNETRPSFKRERYTISFVKQKNTITKDNIQLLQILDSIRYVKKIPDCSLESACIRFSDLIKRLSNKDKITIIRLALKYPPSTRALLGALVCNNDNNDLATPLKYSLNPITQYSFPGVKQFLSTAEQWGIK